MKKLILAVLVMISLTATTQAQTFGYELPDDFTSVSIQIDPMGSFDKDGINSVLTFQAVDFGVIEWEVQCQTIFTTKYSNDNNMQLDYLDFQFGPGYMVGIGDRVALTGGVHGGFLYRGANNIRESDSGGMIWGVTGKARVWFGKKIAFVVSTAYDHRSDLDKFVLNSRGGLEFILD